MYKIFISINNNKFKIYLILNMRDQSYFYKVVLNKIYFFSLYISVYYVISKYNEMFCFCFQEVF